jgi:hypothetical protein
MLPIKTKQTLQSSLRTPRVWFIAMMVVAAGCSQSPFGNRGLWSRAANGVRLTGLDFDKTGAVYAAGELSGEKVDLGTGELRCAGGVDMLLAKYDSRGKPLWSRSIGDESNQSANAIAVDGAGKVFVVGAFEGTLDLGGKAERLVAGAQEKSFVASLSTADGAGRWSKGYRLGAGGDFSDVAVDRSDGSIVVGGSAAVDVDFGGSPLTGSELSGVDAIVVRFDGEGRHRWSKRFASPGVQMVKRVAVDAKGAVFIAGSYTYTVSFGGKELPATAQIPRLFLAKFDREGNFLWSHGFRGSGVANIAKLMVDQEGNAVIAGELGGSIDFGAGSLAEKGKVDAFAAKFDPDGKLVWGQRYGGVDATLSVKAAGVDTRGNIWLGGDFSGALALFTDKRSESVHALDAVVFKLDKASGAVLWAGATGDRYNQSVQFLGFAPHSDIAFITGSFMGTVDFGGARARMKNPKNAELYTFLVATKLETD